MLGSVIELIRSGTQPLPQGVKPGSRGLARTGPIIWTLGILCTLIEHCGERSALYPKCLQPVEELELTGQELAFAEGWTGVVLPYRAFGFHPLHVKWEPGRTVERHQPDKNHLAVHKFEGSWRKFSASFPLDVQ